MINCLEFIKSETRYRLVPNQLIWHWCIARSTAWIIDQTLQNSFPRRDDVGGTIWSEGDGLCRRERHRHKSWRRYWPESQRNASARILTQEHEYWSGHANLEIDRTFTISYNWIEEISKSGPSISYKLISETDPTAQTRIKLNKVVCQSQCKSKGPDWAQ
jgi:hypothetical protein